MYQLKRKVILLTSVLMITFTILLTTAIGSRIVKPHHIVVGAKNCTEQHILSEMMAIMIEHYLDVKVIRRFHLDNTAICFSALKSGEIDPYDGPDFTPTPGTLSDFFYGRFRGEFRPVMDAWLATDPQDNLDAPPTPFDMTEYHVAEFIEYTLDILIRRRQGIVGQISPGSFGVLERPFHI